MADLDDFFAKKDRKKSKGNKKFSTPEEVAKKIEDTKQKNDQKNRKDRQPGQGQEGEDGNPMPIDEDEWREYEVAKKDYTGLKIQPLAGNVSNAGGNNGTDSQGNEGNNMGQQMGSEGSANNPWNKPAETTFSEPVAAPVAAPAPPAPVGSYVAPGLKNRKAQQGSEALRRGQRAHAPDIHNEEYFPSLGGDKKGGAGTGGGAWTEAGGGSNRIRNPPSGLQPSRDVPLGNRFTSLTNDS